MRGRVARPRGYVDFGRVLQAAEAASPVDALNAVSRELGMLFGARAVSFLIADLSGRALVRLAHVSLEPSATTDDHGPLNEGERRAIEESATVLPFDEGPFEQALRTQQVQVVTPEDARTAGWRADWWQVVAPVTARGETIGVLELRLPEEPAAATTADIARIGHLLAFIVIANRRHTDLFEWGQRSRRFSLSAEIQQRLLPAARTCEASSFTLSGWLGASRQHRRGHVRLHPRSRRAPPLVDRRDGARSRCGSDRHRLYCQPSEQPTTGRDAS